MAGRFGLDFWHPPGKVLTELDIFPHSTYARAWLHAPQTLEQTVGDLSAYPHALGDTLPPPCEQYIAVCDFTDREVHVWQARAGAPEGGFHALLNEETGEVTRAPAAPAPHVSHEDVARAVVTYLSGDPELQRWLGRERFQTERPTTIDEGARAVTPVDMLRALGTRALAARAAFLTELAPEAVLEVAYALRHTAPGPLVHSQRIPAALRPFLDDPRGTGWINVRETLVAGQFAAAEFPELAPRLRVIAPTQNSFADVSLRHLADPSRGGTLLVLDEEPAYGRHLLPLAAVWAGVEQSASEAHLTAVLFLALLGQEAVLKLPFTGGVPRHIDDENPEADVLADWERTMAPAAVQRAWEGALRGLRELV